MPVNPGIQYQLAEKEFQEADTVPAKLKALHNMMAKVPRHKGSEGLQKEIKEKISKYKKIAEKEKKSKKGSSYLSVKKEGDASVVILGVPNSGKSTLLSQLTNAKPLISPYEFSTKKPEVGILDYKGVKIQMVELPALVKDYVSLGKGPFYLSVVRNFDLIVYLLKDEDTKKQLDLLYSELDKNDLKKKIIFYGGKFKLSLDELRNKIWNSLGLIKVYTKNLEKKKPDYPPVALKKGSNVRDLALVVHKDFVKRFKFARVWGKSVKHVGTMVGLDHVLKDEDIIELHIS